MCGWGYSFSMLHLLQMLLMLDPLNLPKLTQKSEIFGGPEKGDFFLLSYFVGFSNKLSRAKAVPLHRISKRAEYGISEDRVRKIIRSP